MINFGKRLPIALVAVSMAAAFTVHASSYSPAMSTIQGYLKLNPIGTICEISIVCSDISGPLCLVGATQVWGKDFSGKCNVRLYHDPFH